MENKGNNTWLIVGAILVVVLIIIIYFVNKTPSVTTPVKSTAPPSAANGYNLSAVDLATYNALPTAADKAAFLVTAQTVNTLNQTSPTAPASGNIFTNIGSDIKSLFGIKSAAASANPPPYVQVPPIDPTTGCDANGNNSIGQPC
jgi:hypothetical protein